MSTSAPEKKRLGVQILTPEGSVHDGVADLVQRREQPEDLLRYDVLPARLRSVG